MLRYEMILEDIASFNWPMSYHQDFLSTPCYLFKDRATQIACWIATVVYTHITDKLKLLEPFEIMRMLRQCTR
jgi:hypothetical protein